MEEKDAPVVVPAPEPTVEQPEVQSAVDVWVRFFSDFVGNPAGSASAHRCEERFRSPSRTNATRGNSNFSHATSRRSR